MLILTNTSPIKPIRKLNQVPFPEAANTKPKFAAGVVVGAITAID
jgi:hypothetical protein